jgi:hypothetical protein
MITDHILANDIAIEEMMWLAMQGGAFELLAEEPELYSPEESKPAKWPQTAASANLFKSGLPNMGKLQQKNPNVRKAKASDKII